MKNNTGTVFCRRQTTQRGLSLVELMVAMTIGLLLTAGIGYFYLGSRQTFRTVDDLSRIQESYRYALEFMGTDIRQAGFAGCANVVAIPQPGTTGALLATAGAPAGLFLAQAIQGFAGAAAWPGPGAAPANYVPNTEVLRIMRADTLGSNVTVVMGANNAPISIANNPAGIVAGSTALVSDCTHADVFPVNAVGGTTSVTPGVALQKAYSVGAELFPLNDTVYFIGTNLSGNPALYRRLGVAASEEVVENVENMVIRYGVDNNIDYAVDAYQAAGAVADWRQVVAVRLNFVFRGNNLTAVGVAPCLVEGNNCALADNQVRQVATATYGLRNRLP